MAIAVKSVHVALVAQVLGITVFLMVLIWCIKFQGGFAWQSTNKSLIFNLHPFLIVLGLVILGGEAIITYKVLPLKKEVKKLIHLVLHAIALALGIIGVCAVFKFHNELHIVNLSSLHSWFGIGIIILYAIQWLYGFLVFFYPGGTPEIRREAVPWHVVFGLFVYILAVGNVVLGFLEKLSFLSLPAFGSQALLVKFTAIIIVLFGAFVLFTVLSEPVTTTEDDHSYSAI